MKLSNLIERLQELRASTAKYGDLPIRTTAGQIQAVKSCGGHVSSVLIVLDTPAPKAASITPSELQVSINKALERAEAAIDTHKMLNRPKAGPGTNDTRIIIDRLGYILEMSAFAGERFQAFPSKIWAMGYSIDDVVDNFIKHLDTWAEVLS